MDLLKKAAALAATIRAIMSDVLTRNIGRGDVVKATLLSLVSGRPAFFLGMPGVNKTGTVQAMAKCIVGAVFYEELMPTVASVDQLLVESTSIEETPTPGGGKEIRVKSRLGRAAGAHLFFADELWKGDPRVLQVLLDLAKGDGVRYDGALVKTPLMAFLAASNELPEPEGNLAAMWSRMTIRVEVSPLDRAGKTQLVAARLARQKGTAAGGATLSLQDIETLRAARPHVAIGPDIVEVVLEIYEKLLKDHPGQFDWLWADDRRFGRVFDVLQANALLDGRAAVSKSDLAVLEWLLWDSPEQIGVVKAAIAPFCRTPGKDAREAVDALLAAGGLVEKVRGGDRGKGVQALTQIETCEKYLARLKGAASGTEVDEIGRLIGEVTAAKQDVIAVVTGQKRGGK